MLLAIYLNDHLAGSTAASELSRRAATSNRGTSYGPFLDELATEIREDRSALIEIIRTLDVRIDRLKLAAAWSAEKLGRLKLNGRLVGYSPLSRVVELEVLALGVRGKLGLWLALQELVPQYPALDQPELDRLIARAESQFRGIETHRLKAATEAFAG